MSLNSKITFNQILKVVKSLTPSQKDRLLVVLSESTTKPKQRSELTELLLSGPVFSKKQIDLIMHDRKSFNRWRNITY